MLYFILVIVFAMVFIHPVCLVLSFVCAFSYTVYLNGRRALTFALVGMLPMLLTAALINPAFNHRGSTILSYLSSGNPLTLESLIYGAAAALMLVTVMSWFSCYHAVMTSDKFVYLCGRIIPALSLTLSMALRFVPRFRAQIKVIARAQACLWRGVSHGGPLRRARHGFRILSIMVTWALENAIETADSMKSRGYGLPGRTAFSLYRFDRRDLRALLFLAAAGAYIVAGAAAGGLYFRYFPTLQGAWAGGHTLSLFAVYLALGMTPLVINIREDRMWKVIASKI
jgi:energy-coupling factor transport system permease protein